MKTTVLHYPKLSRNMYGETYATETHNGVYVRSFNTLVMYINKKTGAYKYYWSYTSRSTTVHCNRWLNYYGFNSVSGKELEKHYTTPTNATLKKPVVNALMKFEYDYFYDSTGIFRKKHIEIKDVI